MKRDANDIAREVGADALRQAWDEAPGIHNGQGAAPVEAIKGITVATLARSEVKSRRWLADDLIPAAVPTILAGDGDAGKSTIALQLLASTALRSTWLGVEVNGGRAIYFSAEDDLDELHRRLADIAKAMGVALSDMNDAMVVPLVEEADTILAAPDGRGDLLKPTTLWHRCERLIADWRPTLAIFDPRADLFGGNEISRPQARQFMGLMRGLGVRYGTTVVLLDHPSLAGMSSGSGQSGSTAWRNSSRSMLYLRRVTAKNEAGDVIEPDTDRRTLSNKKANYAKRGVEIPLRWREGVFIVEDTTAAEVAAAPQNALHDLVFIDLVRRYSQEGRPVCAKPSPSYAPAVFAKDGAAKGIGKAALAAAMNRLFNAGNISNEESGPPSRRRSHIVILQDVTRA